MNNNESSEQEVNEAPDENEESFSEELESQDILITGAGGMPAASAGDRNVTLESVSVEDIAQKALEESAPLMKLSTTRSEDFSAFSSFYTSLEENKAQYDGYGITSINKMLPQDIKNANLPDKNTLCLTLSTPENNHVYVQDNGRQGLDFFIPHQDMESLIKIAKIAVDYASPETDFMLHVSENSEITHILEKALLALAETHPEKAATLNLTLNGRAISKTTKPNAGV